MKPEKCIKQGTHLLIYYLKESVANDLINVSLFACCKPHHRRVEVSSVGLGVVCWPVSTMKADILNILMIATLKITMSKWQHCKFDY